MLTYIRFMAVANDDVGENSVERGYNQYRNTKQLKAVPICLFKNLASCEIRHGTQRKTEAQSFDS